jgi:two-component system NtrC family sensor kinase
VEDLARINDGAHYDKDESQEKRIHYSGLYCKFIGLTLVCSLVPLLLVGWVINIHYTRFAVSRMTESFQTQVGYHRRIIESFLQERCSRLRLIAETHSRDILEQRANLFGIFEIMDREYGSLTDLGVIDDHGRHLAYVGPYDLMDKNYSEALWFGQVMKKGIYISDMFSGFREVPHFVIAVTRTENDGIWILRATIDTDAFRSLVEDVRIGKTGEVYLLNRQGVFQTSPRFSGQIMENAPFPAGPIHEGIRVLVSKADTKETQQPFPGKIVATTWLDEPQWMLVVMQDYSEAFNEANRANVAILVFLHLSAATILIVTILITRYMIKLIRKRDIQADRLNRQLMQAGKLAAVGELSAGVAHEINNPLAIVLTERQILLDSAEQIPDLDDRFKRQLTQSLDQMDLQVHRCKRITQNLLRFSRRTKPSIETVDLNAFIIEVIELVEREAKTSGIRFLSDLEENLPSLLSDPSQLQQVFLNMITNAIDAHDGKSYGIIHISTQSDDQNQGVRVLFADTGSGIPSEYTAKVFDPFFTTKPPGKGTGLGLSICYSSIKQLGGDITVKSNQAEGTEFTIFLPYRPSMKPKGSVPEGHEIHGLGVS